MIKYAVLNPANGTYTYCDTIEQRDNLIVTTALNFFLSTVNNAPYSVVEINQDGSEIWSSPTGEKVMSPNELKELMLQLNPTLTF